MATFSILVARADSNQLSRQRVNAAVFPRGWLAEHGRDSGGGPTSTVDGILSRDLGRLVGGGRRGRRGRGLRLIALQWSGDGYRLFRLIMLVLVQELPPVRKRGGRRDG